MVVHQRRHRKVREYGSARLAQDVEVVLHHLGDRRARSASRASAHPAPTDPAPHPTGYAPQPRTPFPAPRPTGRDPAASAGSPPTGPPAPRPRSPRRIPSTRVRCRSCCLHPSRIAHRPVRFKIKAAQAHPLAHASAGVNRNAASRMSHCGIAASSRLRPAAFGAFAKPLHSPSVRVQLGQRYRRTCRAQFRAVAFLLRECRADGKDSDDPRRFRRA
jgi:hypothetical protein